MEKLTSHSFLNKVKHVAKRSSRTKEILLKIGDAEFLQTTEDEIRNLLPIRAYSQKQLSSIDIRIEELKRFVELPLKKTIEQIRSVLLKVGKQLLSSE